VRIGSTVAMIRERIGSEAMAFGVLRGLTLVGGMAALFVRDGDVLARHDGSAP
jgi:hypothetical protein